MEKRRRNRDNWLRRCYCCYYCFFFPLEFRRVFCVLVLVTDDELASVCLFSLRCLVRKKKKKKKTSSSSRWVFHKHWLTDTTKTTHSTNQINRILLLFPPMRIEAFATSFLSCGVLLWSFRVDCWIVSLLYATDTDRERELQILSASFCRFFLFLFFFLLWFSFVIRFSPCFAEGAVSLELLYISSCR